MVIITIVLTLIISARRREKMSQLILLLLPLAFIQALVLALVSTTHLNGGLTREVCLFSSTCVVVQEEKCCCYGECSSAESCSGGCTCETNKDCKDIYLDDQYYCCFDDNDIIGVCKLWDRDCKKQCSPTSCDVPKECCCEDGIENGNSRDCRDQGDCQKLARECMPQEEASLTRSHANSSLTPTSDSLNLKP